jgi:hypothetical protein
VFGVVVGDAAYLTVDLGEEFELSLHVAYDFSVEGAEDEGVFGLEGGVEGGVDLQQLLRTGQREEHQSL